MEVMIIGRRNERSRRRMLMLMMVMRKQKSHGQKNVKELDWNNMGQS